MARRVSYVVTWGRKRDQRTRVTSAHSALALAAVREADAFCTEVWSVGPVRADLIYSTTRAARCGLCGGTIKTCDC